jgi:hypothetical protein
MTVQELIDKMREIKQVLTGIDSDDTDDVDDCISIAVAMIDNTIIDYRVETAPAMRTDGDEHLAEYNQVRERAGLDPLG